MNPAKGVEDLRFDTTKNLRFKRLPAKKRKIVLDERFASIKTDAAATGLLKNPKTGKFEQCEPILDNVEFESPDHHSDRSRGFEWSAESSSDESDASNESECVEMSKVWQKYDEDIPTGDETSRISIMGCDWDSINAQDIFYMLESYIGEGSISSVKIYMSDFGAQKLKEELVKGPKLDLPKVAVDGNQCPEENEVSSEDMTDIEDNPVQDENVVNALRKYQKERSMYYYAVVECKNVETASTIYNEFEDVDCDFALDGLDIRFIPDSLPPFTDTYPRKPTSIATSSDLVFTGFDSKMTVDALRHSRVKCVWDKSSVTRSRMLRRKFNQSELAELDLKNYLASDSDTTADSDIIPPVSVGEIELPPNMSIDVKKTVETPVPNSIETYRKILLNIESDSETAEAANKKPEKPDKHDLNKIQKAVKNDQKTFTYLKGKGIIETKDSFSDSETELKKDTKPKKKPKEKVSTALQNLYQHETAPVEKKSRKNKKSKEEPSVDFTDERFQELFTNAELDVDTANPKFKNSEAYKQLIQEKAKRKKLERLKSKIKV